MSNPLFTLSKMAQEQISKLLVDNNNAIGLKIGYVNSKISTVFIANITLRRGGICFQNCEWVLKF